MTATTIVPLPAGTYVKIADVSDDPLLVQVRSVEPVEFVFTDAAAPADEDGGVVLKSPQAVTRDIVAGHVYARGRDAEAKVVVVK